MASHRQRGWQVPGFGLPLQWPRTRPLENKSHPIGDEDILLRSALDNSSNSAYCYTVRELTMLAWINELTDTPDWQKKIFDPDFTFEWKAAKVMTGYDVTRSMADWCIEEAKYHTHAFMDTQTIPSLDGGVLKSDTCVDATTQIGLQKAISTLRKYSKDFKRGLDLVDPYFFPLTWEKTRVLRQGSIWPINCITRCGEGQTVERPPKGDCKEPDHGRYRNDMAYSRQFQWLPFDVLFTADGLGQSRISSYINNVHPTQHPDFYKAIEGLIDIFIPTFNRVIIDLKDPGYFNQRIHLVEFGRDPFIKREPDNFRPPEQRAWGNFLDNDGHFHISMFVDLKKEFWNTGLQMVLHLQDIELSPDNPMFGGEEFHVQGQTNERICASAMYIYSTSNISTSTPPQISFRCPVLTEETIAAKGSIHTPPFLPEIYGAKHGEPAVQAMGSISMREGRVIVWPNTFQTRILPVNLADTSKPGHCRILTLHLIDPNRRIMSTAMVPCQRRDWWERDIRSSVPVLWRLPKEVFDIIVGMVEEYPISMEEGVRIRDEFKAEREKFRERHTQAMMKYEEWDFWGEPGPGGGGGEE